LPVLEAVFKFSGKSWPKWKLRNAGANSFFFGTGIVYHDCTSAKIVEQAVIRIIERREIFFSAESVCKLGCAIGTVIGGGQGPVTIC